MITRGRLDGRGKKGLRLAGVLAAACMLVIQALTTSFAAGSAMPAFQPSLDIFGNPLCISSTVDNRTEDGNGDHSAVSDTCAGACNVFSFLAVEDRAGTSLSNPRVPTATGSSAHADVPKKQPFPAREPGSPRSPPAMT